MLQNTLFFIFAILLFFQWPHPQHMEVTGQGLNLSHSCDRCRNCDNTRSFNHSPTLGIKLGPQAAAVGFLNHCTTVGALTFSILKWLKKFLAYGSSKGI